MNGQLEKSVKEERVKKMSAVADKTKETFLNSVIGKTYPVLFEQEVESGVYEGYTPNYIAIRMKSDTNIAHQIIDVTITKELISDNQ